MEREDPNKDKKMNDNCGCDTGCKKACSCCSGNQNIDRSTYTKNTDKSEDIVKQLNEMKLDDQHEFKAPRDLRPINDRDILFKTYEKLSCEAACILIMNYPTINFASEMQFNKANAHIKGDN